MYKQNKNGFTLVELLIVVMLIAILAGLLVTVINPQGIQQKARDSQRKADLKKIQAALELYFADMRTYPDFSGASGVNASTTFASILSPDYMNKIPADPKAGVYTYRSASSGGRYVLVSILEVPLGVADPGRCTALSNASIVPSSLSGQDTCFGVENP